MTGPRLFFENGEKQVALEAGYRGIVQRIVEGRRHEVHHPFPSVQSAPEVIVLPIGAGKERAEIEKLDPAQRRRRAATAKRLRVFGRDPVDLHRIELRQPLVAEQRQGGDVVIGEPQIGKQDAPLEFARHVLQRLGEHLLHPGIDLGEQAVLRQVVQHFVRRVQHVAGQCGKGLAHRAHPFALEIQGQHRIDRVACLFDRRVVERGVGIPVAG